MEIVRTSSFYVDEWFYIIPTIGISSVSTDTFKCVEICFTWLGIKYYASYEIHEF